MWLSNMLLTEVGWADGFAMPIANAENKALEEEIQRKEKQSITWKYRLHEAADVLGAMDEQLKRCSQALAHTHALCRSREREPDLDKHFRALAEREAGHLRQEIAQLQRERCGLAEHRGAQEAEISRVGRKLEELANRLSWDQHRLNTWLDEAERRYQDTMTIVKYAQQDESRIQILSAAIEKKALVALQRRKALDREVTETVATQLHLDNMADAFRQAHTERHELILQWENTVTQMRHRDGETQQCALQLAQHQHHIRVRTQALKDRTRTLEALEQDSHALTKRILTANNEADRRKLEYTALEKTRVDLDNELKCLKNTLHRTNLDIESVRQKIANQNQTVKVKTDKLAEAKCGSAELMETLNKAAHSTASTEDRAQQLEDLLQDEQEVMKELDVVLQEHKDVMFRESQTLTALKIQEKNLEAQLIGGTAAFLSLDTDLGKLDQTFYTQEITVYNQSYEIELLELKMSRMKADVNTEDKDRFDAQIAELELELEEKKKTDKLLKAELQQLVDDMIRVRRIMERVVVQTGEVKDKVAEVQLSNRRMAKALHVLKRRRHDTMVDDRILRLQIRRQRDLLYDHGEEIVSQEKQRQRMAAVVRQAEKEIRAKRDTLAKQIKVGDHERQGAHMKLHETTPKIVIMRKRYEILICPMPAPDGEESKAYFFSKAQLVKEELRRRLEVLWKEVRTKEIENGAFENYVQLALSHNETYRKAFTAVSEESSAEYQNKLKLEDQLRAAEEKAKHKRLEIRRLEAAIEEMNSNLRGVLEADVHLQEEHVQQMEAHIGQLHKDLVSQKEKLFRVTKQYSSVTKEVRAACRTREETFAEKDICLGEWRDFGRRVNAALLGVVQDNPELRTPLETLLPSLAASLGGVRRGCKTSSQRSSAASSSSSSLRTPASGSTPPTSLVMSPSSGPTVNLGLGLSVTPLTTTGGSATTSSSSTGGSSNKQQDGGRSSKAQRRGRG